VCLFLFHITQYLRLHFRVLVQVFVRFLHIDENFRLKTNDAFVVQVNRFLLFKCKKKQTALRKTEDGLFALLHVLHLDTDKQRALIRLRLRRYIDLSHELTYLLTCLHGQLN